MQAKHLFSKSLDALGNQLHFIAHSHHLWPDCVQEGQHDYVQDAFNWADQKWQNSILPVEIQVKKTISNLLGISDPDQICFGPNVHTLYFRLLSCFDFKKGIRILSSDSEFHSFSRQTARLVEADIVTHHKINVSPFDSFKNRFLNRIKSKKYDIVYLSQVFYNSGLTISFLKEMVNFSDPDTMIIVDGYHGFGALPTDLSEVQDRIFYLAGGYKYLQSGEGVCFMTVPEEAKKYRPFYTGWFAELESLENQAEQVNFAPDARRFLGATTDPSGLYRMNSVFKSWKQNGISIRTIHDHVKALQSHFLSKLETKSIFGLQKKDLMHIQEKTNHIGHFLTFKTKRAQHIHSELKTKGILTDYREDRLRFGFGLYHGMEDINELFDRLK